MKFDFIGLRIYFLTFSAGNKILFLNSDVFRMLRKLTTVVLRENVCINEDFQTLTEIAVMRQTVSQKCSFDEPELKVKTLESSLKKLKSKIEKLEGKMKISNSELISLQTENSNLKLQVKSANDQKNLLAIKTENLVIEVSEKSQQILDLQAKITLDNQQTIENLATIKKLQSDLKLQTVNDQTSLDLKECKSDKAYFKLENTLLKKKILNLEASETEKVADMKKANLQRIEFFRQRSENLESEWKKNIQKVQNCLVISK